jgi:hypothetical protein
MLQQLLYAVPLHPRAHALPLLDDNARQRGELCHVAQGNGGQQRGAFAAGLDPELEGVGASVDELAENARVLEPWCMKKVTVEG